MTHRLCLRFTGSAAGRRASVTLCAATLLFVSTGAQAQHVVRPPQSLSIGHTDASWYVDQGSGDVAVEQDGTAVTVWSETSIDPGTPHAVGIAPFSTTTLHVAQPPDREPVRSYYSRPRVTALAGGGLTAIWSDGKPSLGPFLLAQRLDRTGRPQGDLQTAVVSLGFGVIGHRSAAGIASGFTAIAWHELRAFAARLLDRAAAPFGDGILVAVEPDYDPKARVEVAPSADGGFVVAWQPFGDQVPLAQHFTENGLPEGDPFAIGSHPHLYALASSPSGDVLAALFVRGSEDPETSQQLWMARFTSDGTLLGSEVLVYATTEPYITGDLDFDLHGDLYVTWAEGYRRFQARGYDPSGAPLGPPVLIGEWRGGTIRTARTLDNDFVTVVGSDMAASVVSLCTPGTSVCGDGVLDPLCEQCDDGVANSDVAADACRTTCRPPRCGDGILDSGESCDDGNRDDCDGCSGSCQPEIGLGCGDGIAFPACGEECDDGNAVTGDGCAPDCTLERVPGGGTPATDCYAEWSVNNPANVPVLDREGRFNGVQTCTDNDPRCDRDDGLAGECTFEVKVCVNNTDLLPRCEPASRLAAWALTSPSSQQAARDPLAAAIREAFAGTVNGSVVGPSTRDLCSPSVLVRVPLQAGLAPGKRKLKSKASSYGRGHDTDTLKLICLPAA